MLTGLLKSKTKGDAEFVVILSIIVAVIVIFFDRPIIAMWIGFALAGYSAIANDSIQTLGTFLTSNQRRPWWMLWLFIGGIMVVVFVYGWIANSGDLSYGRLDRITQPQDFTFLQLLAPALLLILTRLRMPVSTTFLLLSVFSNSKTITAMLQKTAVGYLLAFIVALGIWIIISEMMKRHVYFNNGDYNHKRWRIAQWVSTGFLWSTWLMQDTANVMVFLPRSTSLPQLIAVITFLFLAVGLLMYFRGGKIQGIIREKTDVIDVRSATIIDFVLGILLFAFKEWNNIPMSTTWVFLGLLAGRETALVRLGNGNKPYRRTLKLVMRDVLSATFGLLISLLIAWLTRGGF